ncbi:hypothetical protein pb186bvf_016418 [Paramecium bursaria]
MQQETIYGRNPTKPRVYTVCYKNSNSNYYTSGTLGYFLINLALTRSLILLNQFILRSNLVFLILNLYWLLKGFFIKQNRNCYQFSQNITKLTQTKERRINKNNATHYIYLGTINLFQLNLLFPIMPLSKEILMTKYSQKIIQYILLDIKQNSKFTASTSYLQGLTSFILQ